MATTSEPEITEDGQNLNRQQTVPADKPNIGAAESNVIEAVATEELGSEGLVPDENKPPADYKPEQDKDNMGGEEQKGQELQQMNIRDEVIEIEESGNELADSQKDKFDGTGKMTEFAGTSAAKVEEMIKYEESKPVAIDEQEEEAK